MRWSKNIIRQSASDKYDGCPSPYDSDRSVRLAQLFDQALFERAACLVRSNALRGTYGCMQPSGSSALFLPSSYVKEAFSAARDAVFAARAGLSIECLSNPSAAN